MEISSKSNGNQTEDENHEQQTPGLPVTMRQLQVPIGGTVLPPASNQNVNFAPQLQIGYLNMMENAPLNWTDGNFNYPEMVRIGTITDGSCFFHTIASSYFLPYRRGKINDSPMNRYTFIRDLRHDLAIKLGERIDPNDTDHVIHYDVLSRGSLREFSKSVPQYTLESMKRELNSDRSVDNVYNEFISNILDKDIYLLDIQTKDVYVTGNDFDILYRGRNSIVILSLPGHYELVGLRTQTGIKTLFHFEHPFIQSIISRLREKIAQGSNNQ